LLHYALTLLRRIGEVSAIQVREHAVGGAAGAACGALKRLPFYYWMSFPAPEVK